MRAAAEHMLQEHRREQLNHIQDTPEDLMSKLNGGEDSAPSLNAIRLRYRTNKSGQPLYALHHRYLSNEVLGALQGRLLITKSNGKYHVSDPGPPSPSASRSQFKVETPTSMGVDHELSPFQEDASDSFKEQA